MKKRKDGLTPLQLEIMSVLWERGECTILEVCRALRPRRKLSRNTVATILTRLEKAGVIKHKTVEKTYLYLPVLSREYVREFMITGLVDSMFHGSRSDLVCHILSEADCDEAELEKVRAMISAFEKQKECDD